MPTSVLSRALPSAGASHSYVASERTPSAQQRSNFMLAARHKEVHPLTMVKRRRLHRMVVKPNKQLLI